VTPERGTLAYSAIKTGSGGRSEIDWPRVTLSDAETVSLAEAASPSAAVTLADTARVQVAIAADSRTLGVCNCCDFPLLQFPLLLAQNHCQAGCWAR